MATLLLKVHVLNDMNVQVAERNLQFDPKIDLIDACKIIKQEIIECNDINFQEYGLFLPDDDDKKGIWLDPEHNFDYYMLRNGDDLQYRSKIRILRVRMLDGSVKALKVNDTLTVKNLMITICAKIGIANHDEYSLIREFENNDEFVKFMSLRKGQSIARDQEKLEKMMKKLQTEDEVPWVISDQTLREQGIGDKETLLLKRKLFFSDRNVDIRDPIQLNLLYVQIRDAIVKGAMPVSTEEALRFAGLQCQIQFGDNVLEKVRSGYLKLSEFLPKEYVKLKNVDKRVFLEHKKARGLTELVAKGKYVQEARSLKTYGVTFFLVKEKQKGKNKLRPVLLGINRESVLRMDGKTKELLQAWPLEHIRNYARTPNGFILNFGDYADNYVVQTVEGDKISNLLNGYIQIILSKKKDGDFVGDDGDCSVAVIEDEVKYEVGTTIKQNVHNMHNINVTPVALPGVISTANGGPQSFQTGHVDASAQSFEKHRRVLSPNQSAVKHGYEEDEILAKNSQKALTITITRGLKAIQDAKNALGQRAVQPEIGDDNLSIAWRQQELDISKQNLHAGLCSISAATARILHAYSERPRNDAKLGEAISTIESNISSISNGAKNIASYSDDSNHNDKLLDAARSLADAFTDLLKIAQPGTDEPRQNIMTTTSRIGETTSNVLQLSGMTNFQDETYEDSLMDLAKAVANATANLVLKAKDVANSADDQESRDIIIKNTSQCALAASDLVNCTKLLAPTISNPLCAKQLDTSANCVADHVIGLSNCSKYSPSNHKKFSELESAGQLVLKSLDELKSHIKTNDRLAIDETDTVEYILNASDKLHQTVGVNNKETVRHAHLLAEASSKLVNSLKYDAENDNDSNQQRKLLIAAKQLTDATARMVEAAKGCAHDPENNEQQTKLRIAAEDVRTATTVANIGVTKRSLRRLEIAARNTADILAQLLNAAKLSNSSQTNSSVQQVLARQCSIIGKQCIPEIVNALHETASSPTNDDYLLINSSKNLLQESNNLVDCANACIPTIQDENAVFSLAGSISALNQALAELQAALTSHTGLPRSLPDELEVALKMLQSLLSDLHGTKIAAVQGALQPLPRKEGEHSTNEILADSAKSVASSIAQLLSAVAENNDSHIGSSARECAVELSNFSRAVREVAAISSNRQTCDQVLEKAMVVLKESENLLLGLKNKEKLETLKVFASNIQHSLEDCVNSLPDLHELLNALEHVYDIEKQVVMKRVSKNKMTMKEMQEKLDSSARTLNQATNSVIHAAHENPPKELPIMAKKFGHAYESLANNGLLIVGNVENVEQQKDIVNSIRGVGNTSSRLLQASRSVMTRPNAPNIKNHLLQAARAVTESVTLMITTVRDSTSINEHPGRQECDAALNRLTITKNVLNSPNEPLADATYFDCLDLVAHDHAIQLGSFMTLIPQAANKRNIDDFCNGVRGITTTLAYIIELSAHSAYILAISDPSTVPGKSGIIDQAHLSRSVYAILQACEQLCSPARVTKQQILTAATDVAKHTSAVCTLCKEASDRTNDVVAKRHFVQSAKDVAKSTAGLVQAIKRLDADGSKENRDLCSRASEPLKKSVEQLMTFASLPQFMSSSAKVSENALSLQKPIITTANSLLDEGCQLILAAKELAVFEPKSEMFKPYSSQSAKVSSALKQLMTSMKSSAPGQVESVMAIDSIRNSLRQLENYMISAADRQNSNNSFMKTDERMFTTCKALADRIEATALSGHAHPEHIGQQLIVTADFIKALVNSSSMVTCRSTRDYGQFLELCKTVVESALELAESVRECGGNVNAPAEFHVAIDESASNLGESLGDLIDNLQHMASTSGRVTSLVDELAKANSRTQEPLAVGDNINFAQFQTSMVHLVQNIARNAHDMNSKTASGLTNQLGPLMQSITRDFTALAQESRGATATSSNKQNALSLQTAVQKLGSECINLIQTGGCITTLNSNDDQLLRNELRMNVQAVANRVGCVLRELRVGARGTEACIQAASTVAGLIADLDTTIMFATAGTLTCDDPSETFKAERDSILRTARLLVDDTKFLVSGAGGQQQQQLADAARTAVTTISKLADCVKRGAAALGSDQPEAQALLLHAIRDVATALSELVSATKQSFGHNQNPQKAEYLKESAKQMIENITQLLKTVKTVENKAARGTRALESAQAAIETELKNFSSSQHVEERINAEQLIRLTRPVTAATARCVAAGNSGHQADLIEAANNGRKAIVDFLKGAKGAAYTAGDQELRERTLITAKNCAENFHKLLTVLDIVQQQPSVVEPRKQLAETSKKVATSITEMVGVAEAIQGCDFVDTEDPITIAENELQNASNAIDMASRKLKQLKPREQRKVVDENMTFDEQILAAARSIMEATSALIKAATVSQKELVSQGRMEEGTDGDGQWSRGLQSAARLVARAGQELCEAAQALVVGSGNEAHLTSAARAVASSTAQLLLACRVKSDLHSESMRRLQEVSNFVKRATDGLVKVASQQSNEWIYETSSLHVSSNRVDGMAQLIMAQQDIIVKEKELNHARKKLEHIHKQRYNKSDGETSDGSNF